ncbi:hypothetical protein H8S90_08885 [Olivibacter sp. SDN3]|uniref:hypothetical protein n=1 Tax=Olivibacter sp. SDN3 TaxID=2764720 RepID=UPI001650F5AA|nr:hypothetical protein [Olivibacter sp. SDN3]QNL51668.1 hypothetical protein H8S90_08885 [Olivibacter sp. SDN3]
MMYLKKVQEVCFCILTLVVLSKMGFAQVKTDNDTESPRIINIVNFIRQTDYRVKDADRLLLETVEQQIKLINKYDFPATFLFQYDALINPKYQELMKKELNDHCEIGAWWEITQPHVEAAGIKWRGEHAWVSHANIAFTTGYSPKEREKLVDVYMEKFKSIYGQYPRSVGSWFIDSHTLAYMAEKYGIVASSNCKDQVGTDGYTLWGGYWNQAYYPSRSNAYMPAQNEQAQIPVPIFRMLGSDPIYQYDTGLGQSRQGVISLEPVYPESGMDKKWVEYFLESIVNQPSLAFNYAQAGQENSFTWEGMQKGLEMQFPLFDSLRKVNKIRIETMETSGKWFREHFSVTPATAVTTLSDVRDEGRKSVWFNSRYYRTNILWDDGILRFRDIHLFDEKFASPYLKKAGKGNQFFYYALPIVDGFTWSTPEDRAGMHLVKMDASGKKTSIRLKDPVVTEQGNDVLVFSCEDFDGNEFLLTFYEDRLEVSCKPQENELSWSLELHTAREADLPFQKIAEKRINAKFRGFNYGISLQKGRVEEGRADAATVFSLIPESNQLIINCDNSAKQ